MSEIKFLQEKQYLQQLAKNYAKKKPHLADVLEPQDAQTGYLLEGFAFLSARLQEKIDDAFPEITLPLLQRLGSQAIKGLPSTSIIQLYCDNTINYVYEAPKNSLILGNNKETFNTCRPLSLEPFQIVEKKITHQPNRSCISLTFNYLGNLDKTETLPFNLFLSPTKSIADTLLLGLNQYFDGIELKHDDKLYYGSDIEFCFEPQIGKDYPIFPQTHHASTAPQRLLEGFYLPHVHHFITLNIPLITRQLNWQKSTLFTVNIYLNQQLALSEEQCKNSFLLHCIPVVDSEKAHEVIVDFQHNKASYLLPIESQHYLSSLSDIRLALEPHEKERGLYCHFYPITELTSASRLLPQYQQALFYALTIDKDITGQTFYTLHFYDNKGEPLITPPSLHFCCLYIGFEQYKENKLGTLNQHSENMPDNLTLQNITPLSPCFPPIVDDKYYWQLLSHYSANAFMLMSINTIKQMLSDYLLYFDFDKQVTRKIERAIAGCVDLNSQLYDYILKGKPHRCLSLTFMIDINAFDNEGDAFIFCCHLYHFFPFCLSENMLLEMKVQFLGEEQIKWYLSPSPLKGYKSLL